MKPVRCAAVAAALALCACAELRTAPPAPTPPTPPPPTQTLSPPETPAPPTPEPQLTPAPGAAALTAPPCVPPAPAREVKSKPKVRPAPPQDGKPAPAPAPPLAETAHAARVDAQIKATPTPVPVMSILGKRVQGQQGEDLGRVVDVLTDAAGRVRVAIIDFGGFLGVGDRRIAVDWPLLRFNPDGGEPSLSLSVSRDQLRTAPPYREISHPQALTEPPAPDSKK